ncbi:hypothetical protein D3C75_1059810 [compost metagenome]
MPGIETDRFSAGQPVSHIKFMRSDNIALRADAEQLAFYCIDIVLRVNVFTEHFIQRIPKARTRCQAVDRSILITVRYPEISHTGLSQLTAEVLGDFAGSFAVLDPEAADLFVRMA